MNFGVRIGNNNYNCFCYVDDLLLCSTTVTGLQTLIDIANTYMVKYGLKFNPEKTCLIMGNSPFTTIPSWHMDKVSLRNVKTIKYLGSEFKWTSHLNNRSVASNRTFYGIRTAGIKYPDPNINVVSDIYKTAVESVLQFGCSSIYLNKGNISKLNQLQGKLIKKCLGLGQWCHTLPLLKTMDITPSNGVTHSLC